ncbi:MAG: methyltransferase domain-containing protein [Clostridiales bacterium]|nr:methyltransferase domain-containing protein [Clostridiales bacterium]
MYLQQIGTYWDTRAQGYSMTIHEQLEGEEYSFFSNLLKTCAPAGQGLSCLDIGCGPGFFSILLAQMGHKVTAFDYSEGMLSQAQENFAEMGVEVKVQQGDAQKLPFADNSFDYIVSRNLVWNLEQPEQAYREWLRVLKSGGKLFIADANHYLFYFDNDYMHSRLVREATSNNHTHGVDPTPINEIARDLPLSRVLRPKWDIDKLLELGMVQIAVDVKHNHVTVPETGEDKAIISDFYLSAEKPSGAPKFSPEEEQRRINEKWTKVSDNYCKIINDELSSFRAEAWTKKILENAPKKKSMDILDAGCGPGFFSILLSQAGHRLIGLDGAEGMLNHACGNAKKFGVSPIFMQGDCHALPFADNSFDLVISRNVTHAILNHEQVYSQWQRVLRPDGVLLIFDANWHLMHTDAHIRKDFFHREEECFKVYGSNFSGGEQEVKDCEALSWHRLGTVKRPDWDVPLLRQAGFEDISYERDIIDGLWDDKEKLLYGAMPMFMISARKPK